MQGPEQHGHTAGRRGAAPAAGHGPSCPPSSAACLLLGASLQGSPAGVVLGAAATTHCYPTCSTATQAPNLIASVPSCAVPSLPPSRAWDLINEPRCEAGDAVCITSAVNNIGSWAIELSNYIRSLDSNHLITLGLEGWYNDPTREHAGHAGGWGKDGATAAAAGGRRRVEGGGDEHTCAR